MRRFRVLLSLVALAAAAGACRKPPPPPPAPPPEPVVRVDTVVVTREIAPPLPTGNPAQICLGTGRGTEVLVSAEGDTLVGPARVRLAELRPDLVFAGAYAQGEPWLVRDEAITFDRRQFRKFGTEEVKDCNAIKIVGEHRGLNLFTDLQATPPYEVLYVAVRPGVFQAYQARVGRVRG